MNVSTRVALVLLSATTVAALSGCSTGASAAQTVPMTARASPSASAATASPSATTPTTTGSPSATGGPTASPSSAAAAAGTCGPSSGAAATAAAVARLRPPTGLPGFRWDAAHADHSGYAPCAALSWSVVGLDGSTASSPYAIVLFHDGTYLGTATSTQYGFQPDVRRTAGDAIAVTYHFPRGADSDADPTGRATASFTWDASTHHVVMTGNVPPTS
jgi:hypothetical protein